MADMVMRDYQQRAVEATLDHFRRTQSSAVIVLPTGAGKSLVIAELARLAKGQLLILTHVQELVEQNHAKYTALGCSAGLFSAGLGKRETDMQVTFASIQSIANHLELFTQTYSLVVIDECHRVSTQDDSQYQQVINHLRLINPQLRLLGLTATPYRLGQGWIYRYDYRGFVRETDNAAFEHCIYELPLSQLIREGYLTQPVSINAAIHHYDFSGLLEEDNQDQPEALNQLLRKYPRVTQAITEEVISLAKNRRGAMIFAASVDHAKEILGYLPQDSSAMITGTTPPKNRQQIIDQFKQQRLKFLVNVSVLTTGFDAPHVDLIAILRPTESVGLYQQIAGRGLRLFPDKKDCLIIDYAGNGYNLFSPEVGSRKPASDTQPVQVFCPVCAFANIFWGRLDDHGNLIEHFGRRCQGIVTLSGSPKQCHHRFQFKHCPNCQHENDIAARRCESCHKTLIDPDDLLKRALSLKDAKVLRCAGISFNSKAESLEVIYHDEDGDTLKEWFNFNHAKQRHAFNRQLGRRAINKPRTFSTLEEVLALDSPIKHPDFVIAKRHGQGWRVEEKLFDYHGHYRKANQL